MTSSSLPSASAVTPFPSVYVLLTSALIPAILHSYLRSLHPAHSTLPQISPTHFTSFILRCLSPYLTHPSYAHAQKLAEWSTELEVSVADAAVLAGSVQALVRSCLYSSSLPSQVLSEGFHPQLAALMNKVLKAHAEEWRMAVTMNKVSPPQLLEFNYRIDTKASSDALAKMSSSSLLLALKIQVRRHMVSAQLCRRISICHSLTLSYRYIIASSPTMFLLRAVPVYFKLTSESSFLSSIACSRLSVALGRRRRWCCAHYRTSRRRWE